MAASKRTKSVNNNMAGRPAKEKFKYSTPQAGSDLVNAGQQMLRRKPVPNSVWERRRATLTVAHHATSVEECEKVLDMLGLTATDGQGN